MIYGANARHSNSIDAWKQQQGPLNHVIFCHCYVHVPNQKTNTTDSIICPKRDLMLCQELNLILPNAIIKMIMHQAKAGNYY